MGWKRKPFPAYHCAGLPLSDGDAVSVDMRSDAYVFTSASGDTWELAKAKIKDIAVLDESEVVRYLESDPVAMALGGLAWGLPGLVLGGLATKERTERISRYFLRFKYIAENGEAALLIFRYDDTKWGDSDWQKPKLYLKDFKKNRHLYMPPSAYIL